tara:strand:- start:3080 stop:4270 length:1191 start_codon:yes stop_codon:yes gene_type:complete
MPITNLGRTHQSSISVSLEGTPPRRVQNYTQTWLIKLDDPCTEEGYVGTAPGLPYVGQREVSGDITWICESREFAESSSAEGLYTVTVGWTTDIKKFKSSSSSGKSSPQGSRGEPPEPLDPLLPIRDQDDPEYEHLPDEPEGKEDDGDKAPWLKAAEWQVQTTTEAVSPGIAWYCGFTGGFNQYFANDWSAVTTNTGTAVMNAFNTSGKLNIGPRGYPVGGHPFQVSNGQLITNYKRDMPKLQYSCTKAVLPGSLNSMTWTNYVGGMNERTLRMPILNFKYNPLQVRYSDLSVSEKYWQDQQYFELSIQFDTTFKVGGFRAGFYDEGDWYYPGGYNGNSNQEVLYDDADQPQRVPLDGEGNYLPKVYPGVLHWYIFEPPYFMHNHIAALGRLGIEE